MVHHIVLYKLKPEVTPARVEDMMMNARMQLLKIQEVLSIKCGKRIEPEMDWPFFIAIDFESMDKYAIFREDPIYVKFMEEVIKPNTEDSLVLDLRWIRGKTSGFRSARKTSNVQLPNAERPIVKRRGSSLRVGCCVLSVGR